MRLEEIRAKQEKIFEITRKYGAYNIRGFGSVARNEADEKSDVDFW
jgi:uncharacterized protein